VGFVRIFSWPIILGHLSLSIATYINISLYHFIALETPPFPLEKYAKGAAGGCDKKVDGSGFTLIPLHTRLFLKQVILNQLSS
jgi:hypothetical protein